jgi:hypothetical protein
MPGPFRVRSAAAFGGAWVLCVSITSCTPCVDRTGERGRIVAGQSAAGVEIGGEYAAMVETLGGPPSSIDGLTFTYESMGLFGVVSDFNNDGMIDDEDLLAALTLRAPFEGLTESGLGIGSSLDCAREEFGAPDPEVRTELLYQEQGISFGSSLVATQFISPQQVVFSALTGSALSIDQIDIFLPSDGVSLELTASPEGAGTILPDPNRLTYIVGQTVNLTATPIDGFEFERWEGGIESTDNPVALTVAEEQAEVMAVFVESPRFSLAVSSSPPGTGTISTDPPQASFLAGEEAVLTAVPADGYRFDHWEGDVSGSEISTSLTFDDDELATAVFVFEGFILDIVISPEGSGQVGRSPDRVLYRLRELVELTATPAAGFVFETWGNDLFTTDQPGQVIMDSSKTVSANFRPEGFVVTTDVFPAGGGSIEISPNKTSYAEGEVVTITANPEPNFEFNHWEGDLDGTENPATITMDADKDITAVFVETVSAAKTRSASSVIGKSSSGLLRVRASLKKEKEPSVEIQNESFR